MDELKLAGLFEKDSDYSGMVGKAVERLMETHFAEGHSGFSHQMCTSIFNRLMRGENLTPITGDDSEWVEVAEKPSVWQNRRNGEIFKDEKGRCTILTAEGKKRISLPYSVSADNELSKMFSNRYVSTAKVVRVVDGDTIDLEVDLGFHLKFTDRFRLYGIDTPEMRGPEREEGKKVTAYVKELLPVGSSVLVKTFRSKGQGKYGRWLAVIYREDTDTMFFNTLSVNQHLLDEGKAVRYDK